MLTTIFFIGVICILSLQVLFLSIYGGLFVYYLLFNTKPVVIPPDDPELLYIQEKQRNDKLRLQNNEKGLS